MKGCGIQTTLIPLSLPKIDCMKPTKLLMLFVLAIAVLSCSGDDDGGDDPFVLNLTNLAGTYALNFFNVNLQQTIEFQGIPITSTTDIVGDTFQVELVLNENGNYSIEGEYRITATTTVAGESETVSEIVTVDDSGTFVLDNDLETITINSTNPLLEGTYQISLFNETQLNLTQEISLDEDGVVSELTGEQRYNRL